MKKEEVFLRFLKNNLDFDAKKCYCNKRNAVMKSSTRLFSFSESRRLVQGGERGDGEYLSERLFRTDSQ